VCTPNPAVCLDLTLYKGSQAVQQRPWQIKPSSASVSYFVQAELHSTVVCPAFSFLKAGSAHHHLMQNSPGEILVLCITTLPCLSSCIASLLHTLSDYSTAVYEGTDKSHVLSACKLWTVALLKTTTQQTEVRFIHQSYYQLLAHLGGT